MTVKGCMGLGGRGNKNLLKLYTDDGSTTLNILKIAELHCLR